jgi:hypothetical protein
VKLESSHLSHAFIMEQIEKCRSKMGQGDYDGAITNARCGLSGLSNKMGDRHVREYKPAEHHTGLIVNAAMTFSNFIFDTYAYSSSPRNPSRPAGQDKTKAA